MDTLIESHIRNQQKLEGSDFFVLMISSNYFLLHFSITELNSVVFSVYCIGLTWSLRNGVFVLMNSMKQQYLKIRNGWTGDWEKEKWKVDWAVNKVLFANKYEDMHFILPDTGHMMCYIQEENVVYRRMYGCTCSVWCSWSWRVMSKIVQLFWSRWQNKLPEFKFWTQGHVAKEMKCRIMTTLKLKNVLFLVMSFFI